eukprot:3788855-Pleurochrysis_carterae.AAC.4
MRVAQLRHHHPGRIHVWRPALHRLKILCRSAIKLDARSFRPPQFGAAANLDSMIVPQILPEPLADWILRKFHVVLRIRAVRVGGERSDHGQEAMN